MNFIVMQNYHGMESPNRLYQHDMFMQNAEEIFWDEFMSNIK